MSGMGKTGARKPPVSSGFRKEVKGGMSKFYLALRIVILIGLLFLLAAVFWGMANREKTVAHGNEEIAEEYRRSKPAGYTSYLLVTLVVVGIFIMVGSILYEYHRSRKEKAFMGFGENGTRKRR